MKNTGKVVRGYAALSENGWSNIHISPRYSNGNITDFKAVAGHELIHAYHNYAIGYNFVNTTFSERVAYNYSSSVYLEAGDLTRSWAVYKQMVDLYGIGFVPAHYRKTPFFTLR